MNNKTKLIIAGGVVAVGIATASLLGINTDENNVQTPIVEETIVEEDSTIETEISGTSNPYSYIEEDSEEISGSTTETSDNPLLPYRRVAEKDGILIYYYDDVPLDLMPLLINKSFTTFSLWDEPVIVEDSDLSIVNNYVFVQSENGMLYLSQITHEIVSDERIVDNTLKGYTVYLNNTIECYNWLPFKDFAGMFYGNGNSLYVMNVSADAVTLTINNMFAENFSGTISDLTIVCNSANTPLIKNCISGTLQSANFQGTITYLIENATNAVIDDCGIYANCNAVIKEASNTTIANTCIDNNMKIGLIETANNGCKIENNIVASIIQGELNSNCGAYVGTLKAEIILKNNLSQCIIDVPIGYGGHAIGYADYEYKETSNVFGNYFESELTVEGEKSDLFIGNIDLYKVTAALEGLEKPIEPVKPIDPNIANPELAAAYLQSSAVNNENGVYVTVYNLAFFPDWFLIPFKGEITSEEDLKAFEEHERRKEQYEIDMVTYKEDVAEYEANLVEYDKKVEDLKKLENTATSMYEGFYTNIDLNAINEDNKIKIYEDNGKYYFEVEEIPDELAITNVMYSDNGDIILFFNQTVSNKTAYVALYKTIQFGEEQEGLQLVGLHSQQITGETVFMDTEPIEDYDVMKVMVWESSESMQPVCSAYEDFVVNTEQQ